jgi:hypothetical protein
LRAIIAECGGQEWQVSLLPAGFLSSVDNYLGEIGWFFKYSV